MTHDEAVHELCQWCYGEVGYREGYNNWSKYADNPLVTQAIGWSVQNMPWCATFCIAAFVECFGLYAAKAMMYGCSAGCAIQAGYYQSNNAFFHYPEKGDQIFFYADGDINHTGIVVDISGSTITTVEGNYSDGVYRNTYYVGDAKIAGYGRPNWEVVADVEPDDPPEPIDEPRAYRKLRYGDGIMAPQDDIKAWQMLLVCWGYDLGRWGTDGEFGVITLQRTKQLQKRCGIVDDGIVGEETWKQAILMPK